MALKRQVDDLKNSSQDLQELVNLLTYLPEDAAHDVLRRLRLAGDVAAVLQSMKGHTINQEEQELSNQATEQSSYPSAQSALEFELTVRHPMLYPVLEPTLAGTFRSGSKRSGINRGMRVANETLVSDFVANFTSFPSASASASAGKAQVKSSTLSSKGRLSQADQVSSGTSEIDAEAAPPLCDNRLNNLVIDYWTKVPIANTLAAKIISIYLETDHPFWALFEPDLFVTDLVEHRLRFCSPLLVNSLLVRACVC
jgi:hypothetical protein